MREFKDYLVYTKQDPTKHSKDWQYRILPKGSSEIPRAIQEGFKKSTRSFWYFKYKDKFTKEYILANQGTVTEKVFEEPKKIKVAYKLKTLEKFRKTADKILHRLYLESTKSMIRTIEEYSLDGINVVKVGDLVGTTLGNGTIKKIEVKNSKVMYGILLSNNLKPSEYFKSNSLVYFYGKDLKTIKETV